MRDEITDEEYGVVDTYFPKSVFENLILFMVAFGILFIFLFGVVISS